MREELIFLLEGDDHERRAISATSETEARESCADGFNEQYADCDCDDDGVHDDSCTRGQYDGSEFTLRGVFTGDIDDHQDEWVQVQTWPQD